MVIILFKRVRDLREDNDYTQNQIADILKIHQTTYSDYEIGNLNIPVDVLIKLAKLYNTSTDYILGLTDEMKPYK